MIQSRSVIAIPPGETIKEQLADRGMTQGEFALRMELPEQYVGKLLSGDVFLTPDVAACLELVLGVPAQFWSRLEAIYREKAAKAAEENQRDAALALGPHFQIS